MGKMSDIIDARLKELGIKGSKMCDDLGMSRSTLTELRKGRATTLKAEKAAAIASYLGCSVQELLGTETEKTPAPEKGDRRSVTDEDIKFALFGDAEIDDDMLDEVKRFARFAKEQRRQKEQTGD